jgi:hypothetical protein
MMRTPARPAVRAAALAHASRLVVLALLIVAAGVAVGGGLLLGPEPIGAPVDDPSRSAAASGAVVVESVPGGTRGPAAQGVAQSALLKGIFDRVAAGDVRLVEVATGAPRQGVAEARVVLVVPRAVPEDLERILDDLARAGLRDLRVRSIAPVPEGSRLDLDGRVVLPTTRLPAVTTAQGERAASGLAALVARAGAVLVRMDMPVRDEQPVRLTVRGATDEVIATVAELERGYTSPLRTEELRVTVVGDEVHELVMNFLLRPVVGVGPEAGA